MTVSTTPHINFRGQAREALVYYGTVFGGEVTLATFADIDVVEAGGSGEHIAFGRVDAPNGFAIMACDLPPSRSHDPGENAFYVTLQGTDGAESRRLWDRLSEEAGEILVPLGPAPFAPLYGMLTDRYGITWIVGADEDAR